MQSTPGDLKHCHNIFDLREMARGRLPSPIFEYMEGAAESEATARRNISAFEADALIPRCLVNVTSVRTATEVLGKHIAWPVFCGPTGASRLYHHEGERAVARAAAKAETFYSLSLAGSCSLEEIAHASAGPKMFQIIGLKDRSLTRELILAAKALGYAALCLTVDASVRGKRERELRSGMGVPPKLSLASLARFAMRPEWTLRLLCNERVSMANLPKPRSNGKGRGIFSDLIETSLFLGTQLDPSMSWDEVEELINLWQGPFAVKGIMHVDDARRAAAIGATSVIISNHGGRQLDGAAAPIEVLPRIVDAVGDRVEVILDGGIRRGVQVLKALARGAKACAIGRPYLYGLAAGGEAGVTRALEILRAELVAAMQLSGCTDVSKIDSSIVERL